MPKLLRVIVNPALIAYSALKIVTAPFIGLKQALQHLTSNRKHQFVLASWTAQGVHTSPQRANGCAQPVHVVLVGPTIGEYRILKAVGEGLFAQRPNVRLTYCLKDPDSVRALLRESPRTSVCYRPVEFLPVVLRWLCRVSPEVVVFAEGLRFPTLAWGASLYGASIAVVNAAYPKRKGGKYRILAPYYRWLLRPFDTILLVAGESLDNIRNWADPSTEIATVGNLKKELALPESSEVTRGEIESWIGLGSPVLVAGSTEPIEEAIVLDALMLARKEAPCRLLIAPRQLDRVGEILSQVTARGLRASCRTAPTNDADVFVLDTLGELPIAYGLGMAAFVGGSTRGTGHNVLEPVRWGIPVSYGPRPGNFEDMRRLCEERGVGLPVSSSIELAARWVEALTDEAGREAVRASARSLFQERSHSLRETVEALVRLVDAQSGA